MKKKLINLKKLGVEFLTFDYQYFRVAMDLLNCRILRLNQAGILLGNSGSKKKKSITMLPENLTPKNSHISKVVI